jgi:hypothetical protein
LEISEYLSEKGDGNMATKFFFKDEKLGGAERQYNLVEGKPEIGDYVIFQEDFIGVTAGKMYELNARLGKIYRYKCDDGVNRSHPLPAGGADVVRSTNVVLIKDHKYIVLERKAVKDDLILVTEKNGTNMRDMTVGKTYSITSDSEYLPHVTDDAGDIAGVYKEGYVVLVPELDDSCERIKSEQQTDEQEHKLTKLVANMARRLYVLEKQASEVDDELMRLDRRLVDIKHREVELSDEAIIKALMRGYQG